MSTMKPRLIELSDTKKLSVVGFSEEELVQLEDLLKNPVLHTKIKSELTETAFGIHQKEGHWVLAEISYNKDTNDARVIKIEESGSKPIIQGRFKQRSFEKQFV